MISALKIHMLNLWKVGHKTIFRLATSIDSNIEYHRWFYKKLLSTIGSGDYRILSHVGQIGKLFSYGNIKRQIYTKIIYVDMKDA